MSESKRRFLVLALAAVLLSLGPVLMHHALQPSLPDPAGAFAEALGGPFTLVGPNGREVHEHDWPGRFLLIYFGYRFCPDACPTGLQTIASALDELGNQGLRVQPLFITIDPERDTPEQLARYVALFHPRLLGLSGTMQQISAVAGQFRVFFRKNGDSGSPENYSVDHSSYIYVTDSSGRVLKIFGHDTPAENIASGLRSLLNG